MMCLVDFPCDNHRFSFLRINTNQPFVRPRCDDIQVPVENVNNFELFFSKAFDKVWHSGILHKLKNYGLGGNIIIWLEPRCDDIQVPVENVC
jgi:hypothetical protein